MCVDVCVYVRAHAVHMCTRVHACGHARADANGKVTQYFQPVCGQRLGALVPHKKDMVQMGELFDRAILSGTANAPARA